MTAIPGVRPARAERPAHSGPGRARHAVGRGWLGGLVSLLGLSEIGLAVSGRPLIAAIGVVSGLLVAAAPWVARRHPAVGLVTLIAGTIPFAVMTWWSVIVPFVAVLALAIGTPAILRSHRRR